MRNDAQLELIRQKADGIINRLNGITEESMLDYDDVLFIKQCAIDDLTTIKIALQELMQPAIPPAG